MCNFREKTSQLFRMTTFVCTPTYINLVQLKLFNILFQKSKIILLRRDCAIGNDVISSLGKLVLDKTNLAFEVPYNDTSSDRIFDKVDRCNLRKPNRPNWHLSESIVHFFRLEQEVFGMESKQKGRTNLFWLHKVLPESDNTSDDLGWARCLISNKEKKFDNFPPGTPWKFLSL